MEAAREARRTGLTAEGFERFASFITSELGIKFSEAKLPMLESRLMGRLRQLGLESLEQYRRHLFESRAGADEQIHFIDLITTNKTDFFRESHHFDYLARTVLPEFGAGGGAKRRKFRAWSAGCSSGEEPYTLAMVLADYGRLTPSFDYSILATDISTRVLRQARDGIYVHSRIEPVPRELRERYVMSSRERSRGLVRMAPELRSRMTFLRMNFMDQRYEVGEAMDLVLFRNVMIYFDRPTQEAVVRRLCDKLRPGGHLFLGHSESLAGFDLPLEQVSGSTFRKVG